MKKVISLAAAMMMITCSFAQTVKQKDVPAAVLQSFQQKYPTVKKVKWDKEEGDYEASFDLNKADVSVLMDKAGSVKETETEIELNQLPAGVLEYMQKNYPGAKVKEAAKITDAAGIIIYEVEVKGMDFLFDKNGKFIKSVKG